MSARTGAIQPARRIAYEVISAVRESDAYANLLLPAKLERRALSPADAGLATELTYGTLRMQGLYDAVIELAAGRTTDRIDAPILDVLRLATHQLLSMRVAPHAAVDEAVNQAREVGSRSATGFVNAVLRTLTRSAPEEWRARAVEAAREGDQRLAVKYSHPAWVIRALRSALTAEGRADELEALLAADNDAPRVSLVALPGLATLDDIPDARPARFSPYGAAPVAGDPARLMSVRTGHVRVQDEGSQLAALALAAALPVAEGERWLDLCAGPGGKAALLAALAADIGADFSANEVIPARAGLVRKALAAVAGEVTVTEADGRSLGEEHPGEFDRILVDAPCTGLGALRRRPEARWRKQPRDVPELSVLQGELLDSALAAVKPGGVVAYVTCSPHLAETRVVVEAALKRNAAISRLDTPAVLGSITQHPLDLGDSDGSAQLWPHRHGTDAMFISLLRRDA